MKKDGCRIIGSRAEGALEARQIAAAFESRKQDCMRQIRRDG
jgi:hypothetical protein